MRRVVVSIVVFLLVVGGVAMAIAASDEGRPKHVLKTGARIPTAAQPSSLPPSPEPHQPKSAPRIPRGPLELAGCPPPERPPGPPGPPPWHPAHLVPESKLPPMEKPRPWRSSAAPAVGKGMWIWQFDQTEGGDADAVVRKAVDAGLQQLWIRVGSSRDRFYGGPVLDALVGRAHAAGLAVIGWGFPYLYDPVGDARWTSQALAWRGPEGERIDGFSADIEKSTEGVALSKRRVAVYLSAVRRAAGDLPIIATVYRPADVNWFGGYPYRTIARYVDAFAPMVYWGCSDPRDLAREALDRLAPLRPVHLIGQAYNMGPEGGRTKPPSADEILAFLDLGRRKDALGASFWSWQHINNREWRAVARYPWPHPSEPVSRPPGV
ncbi:MAG: hypothetical protein ABR518_06425 [Actinomycetota bacterium]